MSDQDPSAAVQCLICGAPMRHADRSLCAKCVRESETRERKRRIRPVGGARTPFGTRVSNAIVCGECGKRDHISFRPRPGARVLCRACAAALLGRYELGVQKKREERHIVCTQCGREDDIPASVPQGDDVLCHDCVRGIYSNQGDKTKQGERRKSGTILSRRRKPTE